MIHLLAVKAAKLIAHSLLHNTSNTPYKLYR
ncbi:hypothetical protein PPRY_a6006 [Pseudoalteromonas prydzensis ACAM 620]|nr:hypothetical protein [Pseudoalteromonas prydzensis ACAM 620]